MNELAPALLKAIAAGYRLAGDERHREACVHFEHALDSFADEDVAGAPRSAVLRLELAGALAEAWVECDRLDDAERALGQARALQQRMAAQREDTPPLVEANLALWEARVHIWRRRPEAALGLLNAALDRLHADPSALAGRNAVIAWCRATLAVALSLTGRLDEALEQNRAAWALLDSPGMRHLGKERARVLMNTGNVLWTQGRAQDARAHYADALAVLEGLVAAGDRHRQADIARTCRNLGGALTSCSEFGAAIECYERALAIYADEIRRARRAKAGVARLLASQAGTRMNLGYVLFRAADYDRAGAIFRLSLRNYKGITAEAPHLQDDEARTWVNQAHLLHERGDLAAARRGYTKATRTFTSLIAQGRAHLKADEANAQLGEARVLATQGQVLASSRRAAAALRSISELTRQGQLHCASAWLQGLHGACDALLARWTRADGPAGEDGATHLERQFTLAWRELGNSVEQPPMRGHPAAAEQLIELRDSIERVAGWRRWGQGAVPMAWVEFVAGHLRFLLGWVATLLGESDPEWLQRHSAALFDVVERLRDAALQQPEGAALMADWFLSTRGLRAQRDALTHSTDLRVQELAGLLHSLRRLEEEILGRRHDPAHGTDRTVRAAGSGETSAAARTGADPAPQWRPLHERCAALRAELAQHGLVPTQPRQPSHLLAQQLAPGAGLVLLARPAADRIELIALHRPDANGRWASMARVALPADATPFRCNELIGLIGASVTGAARGQPLRRAAGAPPARASGLPAPDTMAQFAAATLRGIAGAASDPLLAWVRDLGLHEVALVPSDDLHFLPWSHELGRWGPCAVQVYPSVGAWLQRRNAAATTASHRAAWAVAAWPNAGADDALPWVAVERELCRRLWDEPGRAPVPIDATHRQADGVAALLGMGHGGAPGDNPALAGLALEGGEVLTAHDLPGIRSCRSVVLSCCALGQTQDVFGEPLGFLSAAFGYGAEFGSGWLIEVPDAQACLFGVAFQYALLQRSAPQGPESLGWREVFESTRCGIADGHWPAGFGAWLARHLKQAAAGPPGVEGPAVDALESLIAAGELFRTPPESLRRLVPWVVGLGR